MLASTDFAKELLSKNCCIYVRIEAAEDESLDSLAELWTSMGYPVIPEPARSCIAVFRRTQHYLAVTGS